MAQTRHSDEDCMRLLREIDVNVSGGLDVGKACRAVGISNATYYSGAPVALLSQFCVFHKLIARKPLSSRSPEPMRARGPSRTRPAARLCIVEIEWSHRCQYETRTSYAEPFRAARRQLSPSRSSTMETEGEPSHNQGRRSGQIPPNA